MDPYARKSVGKGWGADELEGAVDAVAIELANRLSDPAIIDHHMVHADFL